MEDQIHQFAGAGFPEAVPGLMSPDGDPQLWQWIEGVGREPGDIPDQADSNDFNPPSPGSRPPSVASSYGSIASGVSHPPRAGKKRKKRAQITWSNFDGLGQDGDESKAQKRARKEEPGVKRFACPFYKHDPQELQEFPTCAGPGWTSIEQVREHILRRHKYSEFQCHRCCDEFATETALHDHQRADNPCEKKPVSNKIDRQQEKQLRNSNVFQFFWNNEAEWNETYRIVFPYGEIPSPYYEPPGLPEYYHTLLMDRLPTLVRQEVSNSMGEAPLHPKILRRVETAVTTALKECLHETYRKENSKQMESPSELPFQLELWPEFEALPSMEWPEFEALPSMEWPEDGTLSGFEWSA